MSNLLSNLSGSVKNWWVFFALGILLILSSFWMFRTPLTSFLGLAGLVSALIFVSGLFSVFFALTNKEEIDNFGLYLAGGVLDVVLGFILLSYPDLTVVLFALFIGFWLLFRGFYTISASFSMKRIGADSWGWILVLGVLIVVFAIMAIVNPLIGVAYLIYTLAIAILFLGIANIYLGMRLRALKKQLEELG